MSYFEFKNSVKILSGENALSNLSYELKMLNCTKPLILTDAILEKLGTLDIVTKELKHIPELKIYSDIPVDSSFLTIEKIKDFYISNVCDGIIAVGGGSVIDTAKGLKMLLSQNAKSIDELMGNENLKKGKFIPFIVIPTTSGTGSETTCVAVIADIEKNRKMEFISYELLPDIAVLDPRMTLGLPSKLTASTGIDALCHAIEAYSCNQKNPLSDAYSITAIKLIIENLVPVTIDGKNVEGRQNLANAACMAGISFSNSMVGLVHAIAHSLGGVAKISHGEAIAIMLPHVMEFNMEVCAKEYGELLLYLTNDEIYVRTFVDDRPKQTLKSIKNLLKRLNEICGLPLTLKEKGVKEYQFEEIAQKALTDGALILNKKRATKEDIIELLKKAF